MGGSLKKCSKFVKTVRPPMVLYIISDNTCTLIGSDHWAIKSCAVIMNVHIETIWGLSGF